MTMRKKSSSAGGRRASPSPARAPGAGRSRPGRESIAQSLVGNVSDQRAAPGRMTPPGPDVELPAVDVHLPVEEPAPETAAEREAQHRRAAKARRRR